MCRSFDAYGRSKQIFEAIGRRRTVIQPEYKSRADVEATPTADSNAELNLTARVSISDSELIVTQASTKPRTFSISGMSCYH
jgi:hypothetical protein